MVPQNSPKRLRLATIFTLAVLVAILVAFGNSSRSTTATLTPRSGAAIGQEPPVVRKLSDTTPKHLPIKVEFKNAQTDNFIEDFEIVVTNTGKKPIYGLRFSVIFSSIKVDGMPVGPSFYYGRHELSLLDNRAQPDDVPIKPGEIVIIKAQQSQIDGWRAAKSKHNRPEPDDVLIRFQSLSFGDGTGFWASDGLAYPDPRDSVKSKTSTKTQSSFGCVLNPINDSSGSQIELLTGTLRKSHLWTPETTIRFS